MYKRQVLVTLHRRENWGDNADRICDALLALAGRRPDLRLVFPVHPNPRVAVSYTHLTLPTSDLV